MLAKINSHLKASEVTYGAHLRFALKASVLLAYASVASLLHALLPVLFPATAARIVIRLYRERLENHPNAEYQRMMHETDSSNTIAANGAVSEPRVDA